jgi:hypothetical protein
VFVLLWLQEQNSDQVLHIFTLSSEISQASGTIEPASPEPIQVFATCLFHCAEEISRVSGCLKAHLLHISEMHNQNSFCPSLFSRRIFKPVAAF